jgi:predicted alpha/beta superfamily hydrolase
MKNKMNFILVIILLLFGSVSCSGETAASSKIEIFTFSSNGTEYNGKIYLPASYEKKNNLPAIFLIDFTDQHFEFVGDEFEKVIDGVQQIEGLEALVVSLEDIPDIDAKSYAFEQYYQVYKDMASYVDDKYTNNSSRTFIGRGSEAGIVLLALFLENSENTEFTNFIATDPPSSFLWDVIDIIKNNDLANNKLEKRLHFSFSTSNDGSTCNKLIDLIDQSQYDWLEFESIQYTESDYVHTYPISFAAGLKFVFE